MVLIPYAFKDFYALIFIPVVCKELIDLYDPVISLRIQLHNSLEVRHCKIMISLFQIADASHVYSILIILSKIQYRIIYTNSITIIIIKIICLGKIEVGIKVYIMNYAIA